MKMPTAALAAALLAATASAVYADFKDDPASQIVLPARNVPATCAQYSGAFSGVWVESQRGFQIRVEQVNPDCTAQILVMFGPSTTGRSAEPSAHNRREVVVINPQGFTMNYLNITCAGNGAAMQCVMPGGRPGRGGDAHATLSATPTMQQAQPTR